MVENRQEQIEAVEVMQGYNVKLVKVLKEMAVELIEGHQEDTEEYLAHIFRGVNWELQVINGTLELLNEEREQISKENLNKMIEKINDAYLAKDNSKIANLLNDEAIPFFEDLNKVIEVALA